MFNTPHNATSKEWKEEERNNLMNAIERQELAVTHAQEHYKERLYKVFCEQQSKMGANVGYAESEARSAKWDLEKEVKVLKNLKARLSFLDMDSIAEMEKACGMCR